MPLACAFACACVQIAMIDAPLLVPSTVVVVQGERLRLREGGQVLYYCSVASWREEECKTDGPDTIDCMPCGRRCGAWKRRRFIALCTSTTARSKAVRPFVSPFSLFAFCISIFLFCCCPGDRTAVLLCRVGVDAAGLCFVGQAY